MAQNPDKPVDRRRFFRQGLAQLIGPLASVAGPLVKMAGEIGKLDSHPPTKTESILAGVWLRPPGSVPEKEFRQKCTSCGDCVRVCPAQAIKIDPTKKKGAGVAYIDADAMSCVVCEGLKCMTSCPTGAIVPTSINDIDMGTAVWNQTQCLRSHGQDCTICVDRCPLGTAAITLHSGYVAVNPTGCIGCGVCQHECPTNPKSIVVIPIAARQ